jgi:hypothetical protein
MEYVHHPVLSRMDGRKDSACAKKHCSDGKESRIGLTGLRPLRALPIVRPDVLARRRQHQREFTSKLADQEENSISANSPKLICTYSDEYSMEPPSKIFCGNPYGAIKKVEVASPRRLFKTTMSPTRPMLNKELVDKLASEEECKSAGKAVRNIDVDVWNHSMDHLPQTMHPNPYGRTLKNEGFTGKKTSSDKELLVTTKLPIRPKVNQKATLEEYIFSAGTSRGTKDPVGSECLGDGEIEDIA